MTFREHVTKWMQGDPSATEFVVALHQVVEAWDDLIDKDQEVRPTTINGAFYAALVTIPRNRFYREHFTMLSPIVEAAILDWYASNQFATEKKVELAWALASCGLSATVMCARIIGGIEWATQVSVEFRKITEPLSEFAADFGAT